MMDSAGFLLKNIIPKCRKISICNIHRRFISKLSTTYKLHRFHHKNNVDTKKQYSVLNQDPPWKIMFFGTDEFALPHLKALNENRISTDHKVIESIEVVVPQSAKGVVYDYARENNLTYHLWPLPTMKDKFDVGVVTSFGHLIPKRIIDMFPLGILNVHPSLLPRWRGASPIMHTILNGDHLTGITIIEIRPIHFDIGPILVQESYSVPDNIKSDTLRDLLSAEGAKLLMAALSDLCSLEKMEHEQSEEGVSYAHILHASNAYVNWELQTPVEIDRQHRALGNMFNLRTIWREQMVRLLDMCNPDEMKDILPDLHKRYPEDSVCPRPGLPFFHKHSKTLCVRCKGGWVGFRSITYKKPHTAKDFYNGYLSGNRNAGIIFQSRTNDLDKYALRTSAAQPKLIVMATNIA